MDWPGKRTVPSPKTIITFRAAQVGFLSTDVDWSGPNKSDGIQPDPTASNAINVIEIAIAAVLRHLKRAKPADPTRQKSIAMVIIRTDGPVIGSQKQERLPSLIRVVSGERLRGPGFLHLQ